MKLKKGDQIKVVRGKDKGKLGKIDQVFPKLNKVVIPGINTYKKHKKAKTQNDKSEIVVIVKPLPVSNVQIICPKCNLPTRIGFSIEKDKKVRICKKCKQTI
ncbi:MAG: 50S ribosomal protein L24 [Candidatus Levybacteria bacterium]|nr:50S ribosomal protein L24 [Candidatus Levybacteria bacterium]